MSTFKSKWSKYARTQYYNNLIKWKKKKKKFDEKNVNAAKRYETKMDVVPTINYVLQQIVDDVG